MHSIYSRPLGCSIEDNEDASKMADLLSYFQQQLTLQESVLKLCQPELETSQTHISGVAPRLSSLRKPWTSLGDLDDGDLIIIEIAIDINLCYSECETTDLGMQVFGTPYIFQWSPLEAGGTLVPLCTSASVCHGPKEATWSGVSMFVY